MPLDLHERSLFARTDQHEGVPLCLHPGGPADAVDVVIRHIGHVEADYMRDVVHVQSPRRDVRGHQHLKVAAAKTFHGSVPLWLCQVAVQLGHLEAVGGDGARQALGRLLGAREDQDRRHLRMPQQVAQQRRLQVLRHRISRLGDAHGRRAAAADLNRLRVAQDLPGQLGNHRRHGGGEEQRLLAGGQAGDDALEIGQKAHVQHAIGLVQNEGVQMVKAGLVLSHVVEQPARRGDHDFDAGPQRFLLWPHRRAAHQNPDPQGRVISQPETHIVDLLGQLARRRDDEGLGRAVRKAQEIVQNRQQESGRFTGPRLGGRDEVPAGKDGRDGLGLDGSRLGVAHLGDSLHEQRVKTQGLERHECSWGSFSGCPKRSYCIAGESPDQHTAGTGRPCPGKTAVAQFADRSRIAGFSVHACRLASSIMAGARKPRGKMTQPHRRGLSSATLAAVASLAGWSSTVSGIGLPSSNSRATLARAFKYISGGTG